MDFRHPDGLTQLLAQADLANGGHDAFARLAQGRLSAVYSDPPWSPGNEKWWRRHAKAEAPRDYQDLLSGWCRAAAASGARNILCEQSINDEHRALFLNAVAGCPGWTLPLVNQWTVYYGSPKRPNVLLHFGRERLNADPSGLSGVAMTRAVFHGLGLGRGSWVGDPCMGKGMVSRLCHEFGLNCVGTELNPIRLDVTASWLRKRGYVEQP